MKKTLLAVSIISLSGGTALANDVNFDDNQDYFRLASTSSSINFDEDLFVNNDLVSEKVSGVKCLSNGYDVLGDCPPKDCKEIVCPDNPSYKRCSCFCAVIACEEEGYTGSDLCNDYQVEEDCPILPNQGYTKCVDIPGYEKCIKDDYLKTTDDCVRDYPNHEKAQLCPHDNTYLKCVSMTNFEKCMQDDYFRSSCPKGKKLVNKCPYGNENLYLKCEDIANLEKLAYKD
jgi:hypothetical protein